MQLQYPKTWVCAAHECHKVALQFRLRIEFEQEYADCIRNRGSDHPDEAELQSTNSKYCALITEIHKRGSV